MPTITDIEVHDFRFPTSHSLDGSDAMNADPNYSVRAPGYTNEIKAEAIERYQFPAGEAWKKNGR